jgi:small conductance mechanosensitive channel
MEQPELWGVEDFGPNGVVLRLVVKVEPGEQWAVNREIRARLLRAFDRQGIEIPDQRTVMLRDDPLDGPAHELHPRPAVRNPAETPGQRT